MRLHIIPKPAHIQSATEQRQAGAMICHDLNPAFRLARVENAAFTVHECQARTKNVGFLEGGVSLEP